MPRGKLAQLSRFAADGGAAVIIVDVALNRPGSEPEADRALAKPLAANADDAPDLLLRTTKPSAAKYSLPRRPSISA